MRASNHAAAFCDDDDDITRRRSTTRTAQATAVQPAPVPTQATPVREATIHAEVVANAPVPASQNCNVALPDLKRPRDIVQPLRGNEQQQQKIRDALQSSTPQLTFLHGPGGCGKTTLLMNAIQSCGFVLWQWQSTKESDKKGTGSTASEFLAQISEQCPLVVEKRALIFETNEIDIDAVVRVLSKKKVNVPIFFVDDDEYNTKVASLKKLCRDIIRLFALPRVIIETYLRSLGCEQRVAAEIVEAANGNAKKAVNEYEFLKRVSPKLTESFANHDRPRDLFGDTRLICSGIFEEPFAVESATSDADRAVLMVHQNISILSPALSESYSYADLMMNPRIQENLNIKAALEIVFRRAVLVVRSGGRRQISSLAYCHDFYKTLASRTARVRHLARASIDTDVFPNEKNADFTKPKVTTLPDGCSLSRARPRGIEAIERLQVFRAAVSSISRSGNTLPAQSAALKKAGLWIYDDAEANKLRRMGDADEKK